MAAAERRATALGARAIELGVEPPNPRARRFYKRLGYAPSGLRRAAVRHGRTARWSA